MTRTAVTLDPALYPTIVELLFERAAQHPERRALTFLTDGDTATHAYDYAELHARARACAARLSECAAPGERAILLYPNGPAYVVAFLGCLYAGLIAVPAYPPASRDPRHYSRLASIIKDASPRLLLTEGALAAPLLAARDTMPMLTGLQLVVTDGEPQADGDSWSWVRPSPDSLAMLQYTSGSTTSPKGVMLSHSNLMAGERAISAAFSMNADDVVVSWLPLFHDMGLIGTLLQPLYYGIPGVLLSPQHFMERPERWLAAMTRFRGTVSGGPDFAYRLCTQRAEDPAQLALELSSWRLAFCGAEPIHESTLNAFADKFAAFGFDAKALYPCYGLAESTLLVTGGARGAGARSVRVDAAALSMDRVSASDDGRPLVCCGGAQPEHEVIIADLTTGEALAEGTVGEIRVSGPSVAQGYWNNPEASEATFVPRRGRTWLRTGDLGFLLDGQLVVTGRHKDLIIVRGHNLYPQDVERSVEERAEVVRKGRTAAFGIELGGEECVAVVAEVSPRVQKLIDLNALCQRISETVAMLHGEPARLVLLLEPGAVPITSSGKLMRSACRRAWEKKQLAPIAVYELPPRPKAE
jgi:acyl-CoA synthetase (AMP-forming)/AMP-acid ligase II